MSIKEKVAYLMGLAEGLGLDSDSKEGKLMKAVIDTLHDIAEELAELSENAQSIGEELDAISDDLADVEELLFDGDYDDDDDDDFDDYDDDDDECGCGHCHGDDCFAYEVQCPACGADIVLDESDLVDGSVNCSECGEELEFEFGDDEQDDNNNNDQ